MQNIAFVEIVLVGMDLVTNVENLAQMVLNLKFVEGLKQIVFITQMLKCLDLLTVIRYFSIFA